MDLCRIISAYTFTPALLPIFLAVSAGAMQRAKVLGSIKGVLLDLSGTLHVENTPTPSAIAALNKLKESGLAIRFITNTTKESKRSLLSRLSAIGFQIPRDQIFTCLTAARGLIEREQLKPYFMLEDSAMEDFEGIACDSSNPDAVVVGLAPSLFTYESMNRAFRLLMNGARLIAIHRSRYFKKLDGLVMGPGPFVAALEFASGVRAECVGKPEAAFFNAVLDDMGCSSGETVMVGDDVANDIGGAQSMGIKGILVKTGKYRDGDEGRINPAPTAVCDNFAQAVELILS